jgi:hypothetical protein
MEIWKSRVMPKKPSVDQQLTEMVENDFDQTCCDRNRERVAVQITRDMIANLSDVEKKNFDRFVKFGNHPNYGYFSDPLAQEIFARGMAYIAHKVKTDPEWQD